MRTVWISVAFSLGCHGSSHGDRTTPFAVSRMPSVQLAIVDGHGVRIVSAQPNGVRPVRTVPVPAAIADLVWVGADPVVLLDDATFGRITDRGFVAFAPLPASTWAEMPDRSHDGAYSRRTHPWSLLGTPTGEIWAGYCPWTDDVDHQPCDEEWYARVDVPGPASGHVPATLQPYALATVRPATNIDAELVRNDGVPTHLHCESPTATLDYPPATDELGLCADCGISWISTAPPLFVASRLHGDDVLFAGCALAPEQRAIASPGAYVATSDGHTLTLRLGGAPVGTTPATGAVVFSPLPPPS